MLFIMDYTEIEMCYVFFIVWFYEFIELMLNNSKIADNRDAVIQYLCIYYKTYIG